jgi:hypothetical protein
MATASNSKLSVIFHLFSSLHLASSSGNTSATMQKIFSPIFVSFRKHGEENLITQHWKREKVLEGVENTVYTCSLWHLSARKNMWKYERKLSKQNYDKSIESVKVEVHFIADVKMLPARLFTGMLKRKNFSLMMNGLNLDAERNFLSGLCQAKVSAACFE